MPHDQSLRRRAYCRILIDGQDVTDRFEPFLISVTVKDVLSQDGLDTASIELDDRDARLFVPPQEALVTIWIGWADSGPLLDEPPPPVPPARPPSQGPLGWEGEAAMVFNGYTNSVESGASRAGGGRRMWIEAIGGSLRRNLKTGALFSMGAGQNPDTSGSESFPGGVGDIPFGDFIQQVAKNHGVNLQISGDIANHRNDWWFQGHQESMLSMLQRYAHAIGYKFKIQGNTVYIVGNDGSALSGFNPTAIDAVWGVNLTAWRIRPYASRPAYGQFTARWFDSVNGGIRTIGSQIGSFGPFGSLPATFSLPAMAPNAQMGDLNNRSAEKQSEDKRGFGWATINGEARCRAGGTLVISGARPGVDGVWFIKEAEHKYYRGGGYTTRCEVENPDWR